MGSWYRTPWRFGNCSRRNALVASARYVASSHLYCKSMVRYGAGDVLRGADHLINAASKGSLVVKEARGADEIKGVYQFAEGTGQYIGQSGKVIERLQNHGTRLGTDPQFIKITHGDERARRKHGTQEAPSDFTLSA